MTQSLEDFFSYRGKEQDDVWYKLSRAVGKVSEKKYWKKSSYTTPPVRHKELK